MRLLSSLLVNTDQQPLNGLYIETNADDTEPALVAGAFSGSNTVAGGVFGSGGGHALELYANNAAPLYSRRYGTGILSHAVIASDSADPTTVGSSFDFMLRHPDTTQSIVASLQTRWSSSAAFAYGVTSHASALQLFVRAYNGELVDSLTIGASVFTGHGFYQFSNISSRSAGYEQGVVLEDISSDGRMSLHHTTNTDSLIEFWPGGSGIRLINVAILGSLGISDPLLVSTNNGSNDVRLHMKKSGNGGNQTIKLYGQCYAAANGTAPHLLYGATSHRFNVFRSTDAATDWFDLDIGVPVLTMNSSGSEGTLGFFSGTSVVQASALPTPNTDVVTTSYGATEAGVLSDIQGQVNQLISDLTAYGLFKEPA